MLIVKETPIDSHKEIEERDPSIERQFGNLCSWELAISVPEFDDSLVCARGVLIRQNTIVTGVFDVVFDGTRVFQMYGLGEDQVLGLLCGVGRQDELPDVVGFAESGLDILLLANTSFL